MSTEFTNNSFYHTGNCGLRRNSRKDFGLSEEDVLRILKMMMEGISNKEIQKTEHRHIHSIWYCRKFLNENEEILKNWFNKDCQKADENKN